MKTLTSLAVSLLLGAASTLTPCAAQEVGLAQGQVLLDLELPTLDGETMRLSSLRGKKLLLVQFASW